MTVILAYASAPELVIVAAVATAAAAMLYAAIRPRPTSPSWPAPRADREPRSNVKPLGPRPYDWQRDEPVVVHLPLPAISRAPRDRRPAGPAERPAHEAPVNAAKAGPGAPSRTGPRPARDQRGPT